MKRIRPRALIPHWDRLFNNLHSLSSRTKGSILNPGKKDQGQKNEKRTRNRRQEALEDFIGSARQASVNRSNTIVITSTRIPLLKQIFSLFLLFLLSRSERLSEVSLVQTILFSSNGTSVFSNISLPFSLKFIVHYPFAPCLVTPCPIRFSFTSFCSRERFLSMM